MFRKEKIMKLSDYMNSLVGKEFSSEHIRAISEEIDGIKARATEKVNEKLTKANEDLKTATKSLATYKDAETETADKAEFIKAGGHESQFEFFKENFSRDAEGKYDFAGKIKSFPTLSKEADPAFSAVDATQQNNNPGGGGGSQDLDELPVT